ncbi:MAG: L-threonylcarbamoyladenylate synthase, partial [Phormidesmis sp.]
MVLASIDQIAIALSTTPTLISFPTDTVPALAARPQHADLIYKAKRRPLEKPLILMGASLPDLLPYVLGDADAFGVWQAIAQKHWPGQLTLVLPASDRTPSALNSASNLEATGTIGIRVPHHPAAIALLTRTGPLATTSANLSGQPPLTDPQEIAQTFPTALVLSVPSGLAI